MAKGKGGGNAPAPAAKADRRNGKSFKKTPQKVCTKADHGIKGGCKAHPGKTTDGYSKAALTRKGYKQAAYAAQAAAGS